MSSGCRRLGGIRTMGNFIAVTVMIPVINHSIGIDTTFFRALVQSITVVIYYYFCRITDQFLVANFPLISADDVSLC